MKRKNHMLKNNTIIIIILILGAALRLINLTGNPPALNWDEVSHGYNAYSILRTGADEWGKNFPLTNFRAYGDYPLPLNLYLTIPFVKFLELSVFSIRFPHAFLGILTIAASYFLATGISKDKRVGLLTAFLVAVEPWHLFTSRFVVQSNLAVFFLTTTLALYFNRDKNKWLLPLSSLFLGLTLYSYHTTRILSPLLLIGAVLLHRQDIIRSLRKLDFLKIASIIILLIFFLPLPFILSNPQARARSKEVFIIDEGAVGKIEEKRNNSQLPFLLNKLLYNRPAYFGWEFANNYVSYFSPKFLFLEGGTQYQFSVPGKGLLNPVNLPFFYLGLMLLILRGSKGDKKYQLLLFWLIISPIPASITKENFAVLRATTMLPLPQLLSSLGFVYFIEWLAKKNFKPRIGKKSLITFYLLFLLIFLTSYLKNYFGEYRIKYSWAWQFGYKEAVMFIKNNYEDYDKIIMTKKYGEPHEFILFYWPWDPKSYRQDPNLLRYYQSNWYWVDRFDKFYFVNDWEIPRQMGEQFKLESGEYFSCDNIKCLLVTSSGNYPLGWRKLKTINFLDGNPAFEIYEN